MAAKKWFKIDIKKISRSQTLKKTGLIAGAVIVVLGLLIFFYNFSFRDKIFPHTYIGAVNLGGKTQSQAEEILKGQMEQAGKSSVELSFNDTKWQIGSNDIDLKYDPQKSVGEAWHVGREGGFGEIVLEQLKSVFSSNRQMASFDYNQSKLNGKILEMADKVNINEHDASVRVEGLEPVVVSEQSGRKLDFNSTQKAILDTFGGLKNQGQIALPVNEVQPKVTAAAAKIAADEVKNILSNEIALSSDKKNYTLAAKDFAPWLEFIGTPPPQNSAKIDLKNIGRQEGVQSWNLAVAVNFAPLGDYLNSISGEINQDPQDAKFQVQDGQVTAFQLSQTGYQLDQNQAKNLISAAILGSTKTVKLPIKVTQPEITSDSASAMGLTELVGEGKTSWRGSPSNRIHNLSLGAEKLSGIIVKPGEEFSTVKAIGYIGASTGFLPELVIKNSTQVVPDYGGGLCQVSTTLFRAALNSGLKITDRTPHSFRVSYYEPPVGMDATIYDPAPDFKFVNNYSTPILIWGMAGSNTLTFQIYGTKDGRQIDISTPVVSNYVPPGPSVYQESDTMEPGTIRQVEKAQQGATASFNYKVTSASGEVLQKETFISKYVPLANSYLVGPGYEVPPPE